MINGKFFKKSWLAYMQAYCFVAISQTNHSYIVAPAIEIVAFLSCFHCVTDAAILEPDSNRRSIVKCKPLYELLSFFHILQ
jgi:hypothetical protein